MPPAPSFTSTEECMEVSKLLSHIPQQSPFRFIDEISEISENHIVGHYTFKNDESFYQGHFPGNPVTPGVILTESMAQIGVVALGIYLTAKTHGEESVGKWTTFFTDSQMEYQLPVFPGERVTVKANLLFWRRMKIKSEIKMFNESGKLIASGTLSGMGVLNAK